MTDYAEFNNLKTLSVNVDNHVAQIIFNRPDAMNTYNFDMSQELPNCIETIAEDPNIKVVVLRGAGHVFMAGGDINLLKQASDNNTDSTNAAIAGLHETVLSIATMDKIVVAAVHGACAGAGLSLMLAADFAYAATGTKFNPAYISLGLSPDGGMSYTLPRLVGHKKALEMILLSEPFGAEQAFELGLINEVLSPEHFENQIAQITEQLCKLPMHAAVNIKQLLRKTWANDIQMQLAAEQESFVDCTQTKDFKQGIEAFLTKSAAQFE